MLTTSNTDMTTHKHTRTGTFQISTLNIFLFSSHITCVLLVVLDECQWECVRPSDIYSISKVRIWINTASVSVYLSKLLLKEDPRWCSLTVCSCRSNQEPLNQWLVKEESVPVTRIFWGWHIHFLRGFRSVVIYSQLIPVVSCFHIRATLAAYSTSASQWQSWIRVVLTRCSTAASMTHLDYSSDGWTALDSPSLHSFFDPHPYSAGIGQACRIREACWACLFKTFGSYSNKMYICT